MKVLGFGDNIIDRFVDRGILFPGGNCVNFSVFARQLGADAAYLGVFGSDDYGQLLREAITHEGVDLGRSVTRRGESGITDITVQNGERVFGQDNGGGITVTAPIILDDGLIRYIADFDLVHSSVYSALESQLPLLRDLDTLVSFDLSSENEYRDAAYLDLVCPHADLVLVSASDLSVEETEILLVRAVNAGSRLALATRGTDGAILWNGTEFVRGTAVAVAQDEIADTMGCGDAFLTAFVVTLLTLGWSRDHLPSTAGQSESLAAGAEFAARQCLTAGAFGHGTPYEGTADDTILGLEHSLTADG